MPKPGRGLVCSPSLLGELAVAYVLHSHGGKMKRLFFLGVVCLGASRLLADAHGPTFGYATSTLGAGNSSIETAAMYRSAATMLGPRFSYGLNENLQLSFSAPFHINHGEHPVGRFTAMMPGDPEAEALIAWRFHHAISGVGTRNESTLYLGVSGTTQTLPRTDGPNLARQPGYYVAAATGHISRTYYAWIGGGYEAHGHWGTSEDHQSNSLLTSVVLGWRPQFFYKDYPKPDVRFFWETTGEQVGQARRTAEPPGTPVPPGSHTAPSLLPLPHDSDSVVLPNSGSAGIFSGPSVLYTYRDVAFQGGVLFPVWSQVNGNQPAQGFRAVIGVSYFFLKGRK